MFFRKNKSYRIYAMAPTTYHTILNLQQFTDLTFNEALTTWHDYFFDKIKNPGKYEIHFYRFLGEIVPSTSNLVSNINIHRYLLRAIAFNLYCCDEVAFVYFKFPGMLFIGYISLPRNSRDFRKARVCVAQGKIEAMDYQIPLQLWKVINHEAETAEKSKKTLSRKQIEKIEERYRKALQKAGSSETIKALSKDIKYFGINSVFNHDENNDE